MTSDDSPPKEPKIAVVGGGISGLAAANRLMELVPGARLQLFEASDRLGGVLHTVREKHYLIEASADNFITKLPWAEELCQRLGLADELLPTEPALRRALVVSGGRVQRVPESFVLMSAGRWWPVFTSPVLSTAGKLRLLLEPFVPRRTETSDESVASFARRRLGREAFDRLVQPLVSGIYTADPERLSLQATLPQFVEQEQQFGSLWRARRTQPSADSGARYSAFVAPRQGMTQLVDALAGRLPARTTRLNTAIRRIVSQQKGWRLELEDGSTEDFAAVVIALPAPRAADCLQTTDEELAELLSGIEYSGVSIVAMAVRRVQITQPLEGFGFVVPRAERRRILAASFASLKFPDRAPDDQVLIRVFVGGAMQPELAELDDDSLVTIAIEELGDLLGLHGEPLLTQIFRWPRSMPQYHVGHLERVAAIETRTRDLSGLELAGNAYRGVGIPQCIHSGEQAAERVAQHLRPSVDTSS